VESEIISSDTFEDSSFCCIFAIQNKKSMSKMKVLWMRMCLIALIAGASLSIIAQEKQDSNAIGAATVENTTKADAEGLEEDELMPADETPSADEAMSLIDDSLVAEEMAAYQQQMQQRENEGFYKALKRKFIEGNVGFMSLVALALVLGLAFCIERIIYLTLAEVNTRQLLDDIDAKVMAGDIEGAKDIARDTRGPVASICYQGLLRIDDDADSIERSITSYGQVQLANLEKGCSWITLFIAIAPSLGFLGTVIGMVMSFDEIQMAGDISPTIVASGMKVALITTIFGIIVALILQVFYNYILNKIEHLTTQMEDAGITLLDTITKYKKASR
jgi:biopolymer transport protein ExbB